jgi:hypothetical protein
MGDAAHLGIKPGLSPKQAMIVFACLHAAILLSSFWMCVSDDAAMDRISSASRNIASWLLSFADSVEINAVRGGKAFILDNPMLCICIASAIAAFVATMLLSLSLRAYRQYVYGGTPYAGYREVKRDYGDLLRLSRFGGREDGSVSSERR